MTRTPQPVSLGFSPCPNDTFVFHAWVHGLVGSADPVAKPRLEDVETLNERALRGELDVVKVSFGVLPHLLREYALLRCGGALGRGCGPLVVARTPLPPDALRTVRIAIPGVHTTANLLLRLFAPGAAAGIPMPYDRIMPAVAAGEVDAGLIIHESRFTYPDHGLSCVVDLGEWWEAETGAPIPLGAILARRSLGPAIDRIERSVRESVEYAFRHPNASTAYVRAHAREMSEEVTRSHIELYVNRHSVDLGADGEAAVRTLFLRAEAAGLLPAAAVDPFRR